jgi:aldose 1-epimerase
MMWSATAFERPDAAGVSLTRTSVAGEEGYPGALEARVDYSLLSSGALRIDYSATTNAPTIVNLTQHTYFDLSAGRAADIGGHELTIYAGDFTPVDEQLIPTGVIQPVDGTPFDFRRSTAIGARIADDDGQLAAANGYDHNFVLARRADAGTMMHAAHVREPISGRIMDIHTTEPGLQFYSGNFLDGSVSGKRGRIYPHRGGLSLETQHYPDAPNHQNFPSIVLRPDATYHSSSIYAFSV